jgi:ketosteroid isomerase-like protein
MNPSRIAAVLLLALTLPLARAQAPEKEKEDPAHDELRALRDGLLEAVREEDLDKQLRYVSKDVVVTWQNGEVVRGHDGLREFYRKNMQGDRKIFRGYSEPPTPAELTILYGGDAGISYGTEVGKYHVGGRDIELKNYWTATLVKQDGKWVIASYHVSNNVLDNPPLNAAKTNLYLVGGIAAAVGLVLGLLVARLRGRQSPPST